MRLNWRSFITEEDLYTAEELQADPALEGFYLPRGIGSEFGTLFNMPTGDLMVISVQRRFGALRPDGRSLAMADAIRPHLARAAIISSRLGLDRSKGAVESLALLGVPAAALSARGRIIVGNDLFAELMPSVLRSTRDRLVIVDRGADASLARALEGLYAGLASATCRSIPVQIGDTPSVVHLIPVIGAGRDVFANAACLIIVLRASALTLPDAGLLSALFGLTPAEARVARTTVILGNIPAAAEALSLSRETVRSQLRVVLKKTGVASQQGLTALLASLSLLPSDEARRHSSALDCQSMGHPGTSRRRSPLS